MTARPSAPRSTSWPGVKGGGEPIVEPRAWLTRVVTRLALDELRSARARRVDYVGQWLPEPVVARWPLPGAEDDPGDRVAFDEQLSLALLAVLDGGRITRIDVVANPAKLVGLGVPGT